MRWCSNGFFRTALIALLLKLNHTYADYAVGCCILFSQNGQAFKDLFTYVNKLRFVLPFNRVISRNECFHYKCLVCSQPMSPHR